MLRVSREVRPLVAADRDDALALCAHNPAAYVYVAARLLETDLERSRGVALGYAPDGQLRSVCWVSANIVPVACDRPAADAFTSRLRRQQHRTSSIFGVADEVGRLWERLRRHWRAPREVRGRQLLMAIPPERRPGLDPDPRVRLGRPDEIDLLLPASAAMFTEEIGYAPYSDRAGMTSYRNAAAGLLARGRSFVLVEDRQIVFKAEIGSVGVGTCQVQGVWVAPHLRGRGLAGPAMAAVVAQARAEIAPLVTLYVNDYNQPAVATYRRVGFTQVGTFATVLM